MPSPSAPSPLIRALALALGLLAGPLRGEEGMWTFDHLPARQLQEGYGFLPDRAWLEHQRLAALRLPGGSGAFVSRDGLVLTNHHVAHAWLEKVSDAAHDYVRDGFTAPDRARELRIPGLELRTLRIMENVSAELEAAAGQPGAGADAREAALARLVQAAEDRTGYACEPVALYHGGETWIYGYEVHDDVRLVLAPEYAVAAFGKDWDNFTYPRFDLDFCLFRVYRGNRPYHPAAFLRWSTAGLRQGDLTFVVGHPGRTSRLDTLAQMEAARDVANPLRIRALDRARKALRAFAAQGPEQARLATPRLLGLENAHKIYLHETEGLNDPAVLGRVALAEQAFQARVAADPAWQASAGRSWELIRAAVQARSAVARENAALDGCGSRALAFALGLARWRREAARPPGERAPGYRSSHQLATEKAALDFSDRLDAGLETALLAQDLESAEAELGPGHPLVTALLEGRPALEQARLLVAGTRLREPGVRRALLRQRAGAAPADPDPLLALAGRLELPAGPYRQARAEAEAVEAEQGARLARARFALYGKADYPDATFSLRLSYGTVATYPANGTLVQPFTTLGGLFDRADGWGPGAEDHSWALPPRWLARRSALDPSTPLNFITSNDIVGGNSGSPVVDRSGALVGLVFDGNIGTVVGKYTYDPRSNRAVSVDVRAILEALAKVYDTPALVRELLDPGAPAAGAGAAAGATSP